MAKRWNPNPDAPIGDQEHVGRRIFDEPKLKGVDDQPEFGSLNVEHFREKRDPKISFDRLGRSGIEPKVRNYLVPRCERQGQKFDRPKGFEGWAVIKVKDLVNKWKKIPQWEVHASPVKLEENEEFSDNEYHADAKCTEDNNDLGTALFLRHLFERYGRFEILDQKNCPTERKSPVAIFLERLSGWVKGWFFIK